MINHRIQSANNVLPNDIVQPTVPLAQTPVIVRRPLLQKTGCTYAEALGKSSIPVEAIRNIEIITNEGDTEKRINDITEQIRGDNALADLKIVSVVSEGSRNFTVKCANYDDALAAETHITRKYRQSVRVTKPAAFIPQVKITRLFTELTNHEDIVAQIHQSNEWTQSLQFAVRDPIKFKQHMVCTLI